MKQTTIFISIILLLSSCSFKPPYLTNVGKLNIKTASKSDINMGLELGIDNASSFNYKVKSFQLKATVNDKNVGDVTLNNGDKLTVRKKTKANYPLNLSMSPSQNVGVKDLLNLARSGSADVHIQGLISLKAFIFTKRIPIDIHQNLNIPFIK